MPEPSDMDHDFGPWLDDPEALEQCSTLVNAPPDRALAMLVSPGLRTDVVLDLVERGVLNRYWVARNCVHEQLFAALSLEPGALTAESLAHNRALPEPVQLALARIPVPMVQMALLGNQRLTEAAAGEILEHTAAAERRGMVDALQRFKGLHLRLAQDPDPLVRARLARRAGIDPPALRALSFDPDPRVLGALVDNLSVSMGDLTPDLSVRLLRQFVPGPLLIDSYLAGCDPDACVALSDSFEGSLEELRDVIDALARDDAP